MTVEEKAKAYDEALERAKAYHRNELAGTRQEMTEYIFPELRESEDETIRNEILAYIGSKLDINLETHNRWCSYLEKQKEQKPDIEHIQQSWYMEGYKDREHNREPKWIIKTGEEGPKYELNPKYGQDLIKEQKLWTFNEPYDPDECEVVIEGNAISLKRKEQKLVDYDHEMWKNCEANFEGGKKEVIEHPEKYGLQKPAEWSEVDEENIDSLIIILYEALSKGISCQDEVLDLIDWLRSLRPQTRWKPSEEQMTALCDVITMKRAVNEFAETKLRELYVQLMTQKEND